MTRQIDVGGVKIGGGARVSVQSMTNTPTSDVEATLEQIKRLAVAGCEIVRVTVPDEASAAAVRHLVDGSPVPLVADIHFDHRLAIAAIEGGIAKVRINPGNIGGESNVRELAACLKAHGIPVRIGVNTGSIEKPMLEKYGGPTAEGMVESALSHARMLEKCGFDDICLSMKASTVRLTVEAYRLASRRTDYPLHLGVTEAGTLQNSIVKSSIGIGALLLDGIGDTIRVSISGDPEPEAGVGLSILRSIGLRNDAIDIVSCPTCGRCGIDVAAIANRVAEATRGVKIPLRVAVMGCVVNGPGEAREADIGVAGGKDGGALFVKGQAPRSVKGQDLADALIEEIHRVANTNGKL